MEPEYRNQRAEIQQVFSDQENDALRVLAKIIARRHIRNELKKIKEPTSENNVNHDIDNESSNN